jgi:hypothetical protein
VVILSPVIFVFLLWALQAIFAYKFEELGELPTAEPLQGIPKCQVSPEPAPSCLLTLLLAPLLSPLFSSHFSPLLSLSVR